MANDGCDTELRLAVSGGYRSPATHARHCERIPSLSPHLWFPISENKVEEGGQRKVTSVELETLERHKIKEIRDGVDDSHSVRKKLRLTKDEFALLEESFHCNKILTAMEKHKLAHRLGLSPRQVEVWFQNRRARTKLKETEVDNEALKKWCKTLNDENTRLKRELKEVSFCLSKVEAMVGFPSHEKKPTVIPLNN